MNHVKLAVSRDFRINQATVQAQLERSAALRLSSDSEGAGEVPTTGTNQDEVLTEPHAPLAISLQNFDARSEDANADTSHLVLASEPITSDKDEEEQEENTENQQPTNSTSSYTPQWGRVSDFSGVPSHIVLASYLSPEIPTDISNICCDH